MTDSTGRSRGFGFVSFNTQEEATKAVTELNGKFLSTKPLYVAKFQRREDRRQQLQIQHMNLRQQQMPAYGMTYPPFMLPVQQQYGFMRPGRPTTMNQQSRYGATFSRPPVMSTIMNPRARPPSMAMAGGQAQNRRPNMRRPEQLTASALASMSEADQKRAIGERLFPLIHERHGPMAGKITGMLLEMDHSELLHMLEVRKRERKVYEREISLNMFIHIVYVC